MYLNAGKYYETKLQKTLKTKFYLFPVGRSRGKTIMFVENVCENSDENNRNVIKEVDVLEEDEEEMELEQPAQKKTKQ